MAGQRSLIITADDYGIGPQVSRGILDIGTQGLLSAAVLLVTSPHAATAVQAWRQAGMPMEMGWHPCLTLDGPILPPEQVPSLVQEHGQFCSLGTFTQRLYCGRIRAAEIAAELAAQYERFRALVGHSPRVVNTHQHVQVFPPVGALLQELLARSRPLPYVRRIREPWSMLAQVPGARCKRAFLSFMGRREARRLDAAQFRGNDCLAGVADTRSVTDPDYLVRWVSRAPGQVVELACHPGYLDETLIGRDCTPHDGMMQRRTHELRQLREPRFREACRRAGFRLMSSAELIHGGQGSAVRVA